MVTQRLQVRCRPVKVRRSETYVLPLSHPTNDTVVIVVIIKNNGTVIVYNCTRRMMSGQSVDFR